MCRQVGHKAWGVPSHGTYLMHHLWISSTAWHLTPLICPYNLTSILRVPCDCHVFRIVFRLVLQWLTTGGLTVIQHFLTIMMQVDKCNCNDGKGIEMRGRWIPWKFDLGGKIIHAFHHLVFMNTVLVGRQSDSNTSLCIFCFLWQSTDDDLNLLAFIHTSFWYYRIISARGIRMDSDGRIATQPSSSPG